MSENGNGSTSSGQPAAKKSRLESEPAEERDFDEETQKALEEIDAAQNEIDTLNEQASEEILKVEQKYNQLRKPFYGKRNEIISRIPKFWLTAFINHPQIAAIIDEEEEPCLQYLNKLEVEEFEDIKSGYRIKLYFQENPFFTNDCLTKEFHLGSADDAVSQSTPILWKEGFNLEEKGAKRIPTGGKAVSRRRFLQYRTFFLWFADNKDPAADDMAEVIKDDLWPNPLQYFLVPDIEIENGEDEDEKDDDDENEENVVVLEEEDSDDEDDEGEGEEEEEAAA